MNHLQLKLIDLFWATGLIACVVGAITTSEAEIAFIGLCCVLLFVWRRPVLLRFWTIAVAGIGAGLFMTGFKDGYAFGLIPAELAGWGCGMTVGAPLAFVLLDVRKPPTSD